MIVEKIISWAVPFVCGGIITGLLTYIKTLKRKNDAEVCEAYIAKITAPSEVPKPSGDIAELTAKVADLEAELAAAKILLGVE